MSKQRGANLVPNERSIRKRFKDDGKTVRAYEVRYRDPDGKLRGKCFKTLDDAREWQKRNAVEVMDGKFIAPERSRTTWAQVAGEWVKAKSVNRRARTIRGYENVLGNWLAGWDSRAIGDIATADVRAVIGRVRAKGRAVGTEHHVFDAMNGVLKYAVRNKYIRENPAQVVREELRGMADKDYVGTALTTDQAMSIIEALPLGRFHLYGLLGLWTGFRAGELAGLRVRNVDTERNVVQVEETIQDLGGRLTPGTTKTRKSKGRRVPIPAGVMAEVVAHIEGEGLESDDYVFAGDSEMFSHTNFYKRQWKPACAAAGLPGTRFHTLRHTFVSLRAREGVEPHVLAAWAGHSTITVTMNIYSHIYDEDPKDRAVVDRIYEEAARRASQPPALRVVEVKAS